eukprot:7243346-Prorocentrum_lima.AAC.1
MAITNLAIVREQLGDGLLAEALYNKALCIIDGQLVKLSASQGQRDAGTEVPLEQASIREDEPEWTQS